MSTTNHLECDDCKVSLWIGQRNYIYLGERDVMEALNTFLESHVGHHLSYRRSTGTHHSRFMAGYDEWSKVVIRGDKGE